jgi:hypothetical protein
VVSRRRLNHQREGGGGATLHGASTTYGGAAARQPAWERRTGEAGGAHKQRDDDEATATTAVHSPEGRKEATASRAPAPSTEREEGGATLGDDLRGKRGGGEWRPEADGARSAVSSPRGRRRRTSRRAVSDGVGGFNPPTESTPVTRGAQGGRRPLTGRPGWKERSLTIGPAPI